MPQAGLQLCLSWNNQGSNLSPLEKAGLSMSERFFVTDVTFRLDWMRLFLKNKTLFLRLFYSGPNSTQERVRISTHSEQDLPGCISEENLSHLVNVDTKGQCCQGTRLHLIIFQCTNFFPQWAFTKGVNSGAFAYGLILECPKPFLEWMAK